jgi:hypothetical protein
MVPLLVAFYLREKRSVNKAHKDGYLLTPPSHMAQHIAAQHNIVLAAVARVLYSIYISCLRAYSKPVVVRRHIIATTCNLRIILFCLPPQV